MFLREDLIFDNAFLLIGVHGGCFFPARHCFSEGVDDDNSFIHNEHLN